MSLTLASDHQRWLCSRELLNHRPPMQWRQYPAVSQTPGGVKTPLCKTNTNQKIALVQDDLFDPHAQSYAIQQGHQPYKTMTTTGKCMTQRKLMLPGDMQGTSDNLIITIRVHDAMFTLTCNEFALNVGLL